jgi:hypothetical protein
MYKIRSEYLWDFQFTFHNLQLVFKSDGGMHSIQLWWFNFHCMMSKKNIRVLYFLLLKFSIFKY